MQLTLDFMKVLDFSLQGWSTHVIVNLRIAEVGEGVRCTIESDVVKLNMIAESAHLDRISASQDRERLG